MDGSFNLRQGRGCLPWGTQLVREVSFAERASGYSLTENVRIDILGHNLAEMADHYYRRQVEGGWQEEPT